MKRIFYDKYLLYNFLDLSIHRLINMPKSKTTTMFYDAGFNWTCAVCNHTICNKSSKGINMMKRLHFKANKNCKQKSSNDEIRRKIHGAGAATVKGSYDQAVIQDTLLTVGRIEIKEPDAIINLNIEHKENM